MKESLHAVFQNLLRRLLRSRSQHGHDEPDEQGRPSTPQDCNYTFRSTWPGP